MLYNDNDYTLPLTTRRFYIDIRKLLLTFRTFRSASFSYVLNVAGAVKNRARPTRGGNFTLHEKSTSLMLALAVADKCQRESMMEMIHRCCSYVNKNVKDSFSSLA